MLEDQGATLGNGTPLRDFLFTAAFLSSSRFGAMVSLFCCQSELQLSRERRCQDICCDCAGGNFHATDLVDFAKKHSYIHIQS